MRNRVLQILALLTFISFSCSVPFVLTNQDMQPIVTPTTGEDIFFQITPTVLSPPTSTSTPFPTGTPTPQLLPTSTKSSSEPVLIPLPQGFPPYVIQSGTPLTTFNFIRPEAGCNWMGVAGQAFNENGEPVVGLVVEVGGILDSKEILLLALTGGSKAIGPGGYEVPLLNRALETKGALWIQLYDLNGVPQSSRAFFNTYADCGKNLNVINFTELTAMLVYPLYLPLITKQ